MLLGVRTQQLNFRVRLSKPQLFRWFSIWWEYVYASG